MLFHHAPILDSLNAVLSCFVTSFFVVDSLLHPNNLQTLSYRVSDDRQDILRGPEDVHNVNFLDNLFQAGMAFLAQDLVRERIQRMTVTVMSLRVGV